MNEFRVLSYKDNYDYKAEEEEIEDDEAPNNTNPIKYKIRKWVPLLTFLSQEEVKNRN